MDLPKTVCIHSVLNVEHLKLHRTQPDDTAFATIDRTPAVETLSGEVDYEVDQILEHRNMDTGTTLKQFLRRELCLRLNFTRPRTLLIMIEQ